MASIHTVLDAIIENGTSGKRVVIEVVDRREYETIRTRLVKLWGDHRDVLIAIGDGADPLTEASLCGDYQARAQDNGGTATFYLGKPRRKPAKSYSFSIVDSGSDGAATALVIPEPANDESIVTPKLAE